MALSEDMNLTDDNKIRLILCVVGIGLGLVIGWSANLFWFAFTGIILGWGDSVPDWYFNIQKMAQTMITCTTILLTIVVLQWLFNRRKERIVGGTIDIPESDKKTTAKVSNHVSPKAVLSALFGVVLGLFVGILVIGTLIRLVFNLIFNWGDSAPVWGFWTEAIIIFGGTILSLYYSIKWTMGPKNE
jgi:hypothetical protein